MTDIWIAVLISFVIREVEDQQRELTRLVLMKQSEFINSKHQHASAATNRRFCRVS